MRKNVFVLFIVLTITALILSGCSKKSTMLTSDKQIFPSATWGNNNIVKFSMEIPEKIVGKTFDVFAEIEHTIEIRRDIMLVEMAVFTPQGDERVAEYKIFFKTNEGRFKGTAEGNTLKFSQILRRNYTFGNAGTWEFELVQRSELYEFSGIKSIQLLFVEASEENSNKNNASPNDKQKK